MADQFRLIAMNRFSVSPISVLQYQVFVDSSLDKRL